MCQPLYVPKIAVYLVYVCHDSAVQYTFVCRTSVLHIIIERLTMSVSRVIAIRSEGNGSWRHWIKFLLLNVIIIIIIIIIIINIKDWTLSSVPSPKLQLLSPTFLRSSNCSPSLWSAVVWFQRDSVLWHSLQVQKPVPSVFTCLV